MTSVFTQLADTLESRKTAHPESSYVASLHHKGLDKILEKLGEESIETIIAAKNMQSDPVNTDDLIYETADLWFHSLVMLSHLNIRPEQVLNELTRREGLSGLTEKKQRNQAQPK